MTHAIQLNDADHDTPVSGARRRPRLLIASSRLPLSIARETGDVLESSGGVASALRGIHDRSRDLWFGAVSRSELEAAASADLADRLNLMRAIPVELSDADMFDFYSRFANGILWPTLHEVPCPFPGDREGWRAYRAANERFTDALVEQYESGDTIWIHDYQLMLLPAMLRRRLPGATIAFFLHTPVPSAPALKSIHEWPDLLSGLLGADAIGVHTTRYARNLIDAARGRVPLERETYLTAPDGRRVHVHVAPIGIDGRRFDSRARHPSVRAATTEQRDRAPGPIFLGVDRLDYTKGIAERLRAFDRLLRFEPGLCGRARFIQIAVPSREDVAGYSAARRTVESLVASINACYATSEWTPVEYHYRTIDRDTLIALYCAADVMVVTPRRDGMNLVAKEFVASRFDDRGVLVLSNTAGAATELRSAIQVDPTEVASIMEGYRRALAMPAAERRSRMRRLRAVVRSNHVGAWAASCLQAAAAVAAAAVGDMGARAGYFAEGILRSS